jgi:ABC-type multidrug transport system fused ATPase/permease subunit
MLITSHKFQFDTTPSGRIVNRFSRDIETVDSSLSQSLRVVVAYFFALVGALIVVTAITPAFFIPAVFLAAAYYALSLQYIRESPSVPADTAQTDALCRSGCGRDLRRMESTARSPIFSGFTETLEGVVTIRAFAKEALFIDNLQSQVDKSHACWCVSLLSCCSSRSCTDPLDASGTSPGCSIAGCFSALTASVHWPSSSRASSRWRAASTAVSAAWPS